MRVINALFPLGERLPDERCHFGEPVRPMEGDRRETEEFVALRPRLEPRVLGDNLLNSTLLGQGVDQTAGRCFTRRLESNRFPVLGNGAVTIPLAAQGVRKLDVAIAVGTLVDGA